MARSNLKIRFPVPDIALSIDEIVNYTERLGGDASLRRLIMAAMAKIASEEEFKKVKELIKNLP
jgi:hypothetical protein